MRDGPRRERRMTGAEMRGAPGSGTALTSAPGGPALRVEGLTVRFGGLVALDAVDLEVAPGAIHAVIGPNGAGKTTLFNVVTGFGVPTEGCVWFAGREVTHLWPEMRTRLGMARTFQNIRLFREMTVFENVLAGQHSRVPSGLAAVFGAGRDADRRARREAEEILAFLEIAHLRDRQASTLPHGSQRLVEIARAVATQPRLLLLDEPTAGMTAEEKAHLCDQIRRVRDLGLTILLIEHDMRVVMGMSDRVTVLNFGEKIAEGTPAQVQEDPQVIEAYLGREE